MTHSDAIDKLYKKKKYLKESLKKFFNLKTELNSEMSAITCRRMRDNLLLTNISEQLQVNNNGRPFEETENVKVH